MKAEINGITLTGTPQEIAEVIKLAGLVKEVQEVIRYVPQIVPTYPVYPWQPNTGTSLPIYPTWTCQSGGTTYTGPTGMLWHNGDGPDNTGALVPS